MDENISWKVVYLATIFSLIVLGFAYWLISPKGSEYFTEEKTAKIAEFKNTRISGKKEGKRLWEFFAAEGWSNKNREITFLNHVSKGKIYRAGEVVVTELTAPYAKAYRSTDIVEVFGFPEGQNQGATELKASINLGKISKCSDPGEWNRFKADCLKHIPNDDRSEMAGHVELHKKDSSIYADKINIDHSKDIADISDNIRLQRKDGVLKADQIRYFSNEEKMDANGNVDLNVAEGRIITRVKASRASFFTDITKLMTLQGSLEVVQGKKIAVANEGTYSQKNKALTLKGSSKTVFGKAQAILKETTVKKLKNIEAKQILTQQTVLTSDEIVFSTQDGKVDASGNVFVTQKDRAAKSDRAIYDDSEETLTLTGNVFMKKEGEWVKARKVIVSVVNETFEAIGEVEAEFTL